MAASDGRERYPDPCCQRSDVNTGLGDKTDHRHGPIVRTFWFHLWSLFLFTKTDFKPIMVPQTIFAVAVAFSRIGVAASSYDHGDVMLRLPIMLAWLWLHLLIFNLSNQRQPGSILEDTADKPWRPIPSGRISPTEAQSLLRVAVPVAIGVSVPLGSLLPCVALMAMIWLYNDLDGAGAGPWQKNAINAAGFACYGWGATTSLLAGAVGPGNDERLRNWMVLIAAVVMTTVHAQDFPDVLGDQASGRKTMPLLYGQALSRRVLAASVLFWSALCLGFWGVTSPTALLMVACTGSTIAVLTMFRWDHSSSKAVWRLWCLWITLLYLLPLFSPLVEAPLLKDV